MHRFRSPWNDKLLNGKSQKGQFQKILLSKGLVSKHTSYDETDSLEISVLTSSYKLDRTQLLLDKSIV